MKVLYITGEAGEAFKANNASGSNFIYAGGAGFIIPISVHHSIDACVRYESGYKLANDYYNEAMHEIAVRLAYRFGL